MITQQMIDDLNYIYNHFNKDGKAFEKQSEKLNEECDEYCDAWFNEDWHWCNEEIADVFIISLQLIMHEPEIQKIVDFKIKRTISRIQEGYYDNN